MAMDFLDYSRFPSLTEADGLLLNHVAQFTQKYFENPKFDASHDFRHVTRVVHNAVHILNEEQKSRAVSGLPPLDARVVILAALLHDVDDKKYTNVSQTQHPAAKDELLRIGVPEEEASMVQQVIDGVSYSSEVKSPHRVQKLVKEIPELAVVQDADRLDALGAIGIGRCFTFGGSRGARSLEDSIQHFSDKLIKLQSMMKTETGKILASERTSKINQFMQWWSAETEFSGPGCNP